MTIQLTADATGGVSINRSNLVGHVANMSLTADLVWALVPVANISALNPLLSDIIQYALLPYLNKVFGQGIPLPSVGNITLIDPEVTYATGLITIATAFGPLPARDRLRATAPWAVRTGDRRR